MKKLTAITLLTFSLGAFGQQKTNELNCFNKWAAKFEERGADEVKDGVYDDVIISIRRGPKAECLNGRAEVRSGMLAKFYVMLDDGSFEEFKRTWKNNSNEKVSVINGMSTGMLSMQGELVNVMWPSKIRPRKAKPMAAAEPTDD